MVVTRKLKRVQRTIIRNGNNLRRSACSKYERPKLLHSANPQLAPVATEGEINVRRRRGSEAVTNNRAPSNPRHRIGRVWKLPERKTIRYEPRRNRHDNCPAKCIEMSLDFQKPGGFGGVGILRNNVASALEIYIRVQDVRVTFQADRGRRRNSALRMFQPGFGNLVLELKAHDHFKIEKMQG